MASGRANFSPEVKHWISSHPPCARETGVYAAVIDGKLKFQNIKKIFQSVITETFYTKYHCYGKIHF